MSNLVKRCFVVLLGLVSFGLKGQVFPVDALEWTMVQPASPWQRNSQLLDVVEDNYGRILTANRRYLFRVVQQRLEACAGQGMHGLQGEVQQLFVDAGKTPWVLTSRGLYRMDVDSLVFRHIDITIAGKPWMPMQRRFAAFGQSIALLHEGGLYVYNPQTGACTLLAAGSALPKGSLRVYAVHGGHAVVSGSHAIQLWHQSGRMLRSYSLADSTEVRSALMIQRKYLYYWRHDAQLQWIDLQSGSLSDAVKVDVPVLRSLTAVRLAGRSYVVLGGPDSLYFFSPGGTRYFTWGKSLRQPGQGLSEKLDDPLQDSRGRFWVVNGTQLAYARVPEQATNSFFVHNTRLDTAAPKAFQEPGVLQVSRYHSWVVYAAGHQLAVFDTVKQLITRQMKLPGLGTIGVDQLLELDADRWLAVARYGLFLWKPAANHLSPLTINGQTLDRSSVALVGDSVFCLSNKTLYRAGRRALEFVPASLPLPATMHQVFEGSQLSLLAVSEQGLWRYLSTTGQWTPLSTDPMQSPGGSWHNARLHCNRYNGDILIWLEDHLWVIDETSGKLRHHWVLRGSGIPYGEVQLVAADTERILLAQANHPVTLFNYRTGAIRHLGAAEGWLGARLGSYAHWATVAGSGWWASFDGGLQQFDHQWLLQYDAPMPAPCIDDVWVGFKPIEWPASKYEHKAYRMSWRQGTISFFLGGAMADSIVYRLLPYDTVWRQGTMPTFTNLPGGDYTLTARINGSDRRHSQAVVFAFKVLPPFWQTVGFRIAGSLLLASLVVLGISLREKKWKQKQRQSLQLVQSELKAIRSQMNPHFIFNCLAAIDGLIASGQSRQASIYLGKFSRLVRQILQLSERSLVSLGNELDMLVLYLQLEQLRMQDGFTYDIQVDENLRETVDIPPMLLQPFTENAIVHGLKNSSRANKHLSIRATATATTISLMVEDNGVGRKAAAACQVKSDDQESMGMRLTAERIRMMEQITGLKAAYYVEDLVSNHGEALGTKVHITLQKPDV